MPVMPLLLLKSPNSKDSVNLQRCEQQQQQAGSVSGSRQRHIGLRHGTAGCFA
jgi:hypothetical protein